MTQHYVGTKIVEAWNEPRDDMPGYAVKYPDGYTSWSPFNVFEEAYLPLGHLGNLQPHEQRMVAELAALNDKLTKLCAFLESEKFATLDEDAQSLLRVQAGGMRIYANALTVRVETPRRK